MSSQTTVRAVNYLLIVCLIATFLLFYFYETTFLRLMYVLLYSALLIGGYLSSWEIKDTLREPGVGLVILIGFIGFIYVVSSRVLAIIPL